ncbi:MAG: hypothetical protein LH606_17455 [Cytophagaceae bacterium]|nr:hypothetical protein [Cytophagaceae bacterium]
MGNTLIFVSCVLFSVQISHLGQQGKKDQHDREKHIETMQPVYGLEEYHLNLYPENKRKGAVQAIRPRPVHIAEKINPLGVITFLTCLFKPYATEQGADL